jgi:hypothetical protein
VGKRAVHVRIAILVVLLKLHLFVGIKFAAQVALLLLPGPHVEPSLKTTKSTVTSFLDGGFPFSSSELALSNSLNACPGSKQLSLPSC